MTLAAAALAGAVVLASSPAGARTQAALAGSAATWGTAEELPGSAALNKGGVAQIVSVSCASPGNCSAAGNYTDSSGHRQPMVDTETNGRWGTAEQILGIAALDQGGGAAITSLSCAAPGDCSAGGDYSDGSGHGQAFVVSQAGGIWGNAIEVPGTGALNVTGDARVSAVSCAAPGDCSAGGQYDDGSGFFQAFVVSQAGGTWGKAIEVPGTAKLNTAHDAVVSSVSCTSAGNCSAGGYYVEYSGFVGLEQAFVVSQAGGSWGKAIEVPGTAKLNTGGLAAVSSVSCASAGNCGAGGSYDDSSGHYHAFVVSQAGGTWGKAIEVPGTPGLNKGGVAQIISVSCAAPGDCGAGGYYTDSSDRQQPFVVSQASGTWGKAEQVPGIATLNKGGAIAEISSVSCASAGDCSAGGDYTDGSAHFQVFVDSQVSGTWGKAEQVPGTATLNKGGSAATTTLSCASAGNCTVGGQYSDSSGHLQAFLDSQT